MSIFGGDTGISYEQLQRRKKIAEAMGQQAMGATPRNVGEGINAIASALVGRYQQKRFDKDAAEFRNQRGVDDPLVQALMSGKVPQYARGTNFHPGGLAVVGEEGPEVVKLPRGAKVVPNDMAWSQGTGALPLINDQIPEDPLGNPLLDEDPRGAQSRFDDANSYQVADMSGIDPAGVGEQAQLNALARSFQGLMQGLDDYEKLFKDTGTSSFARMLPGQKNDALSTAHRDLQMQMKELYNLGVLNGPDLELMNQILLDPTSVSGNLLDAVGISDMDKRIPDNITRVRRMMINRTTPALQQLGIDPESLMPKRDEPKPSGDGWQVVNGVRVRVKQ